MLMSRGLAAKLGQETVEILRDVGAGQELDHLAAQNWTINVPACGSEKAGKW